MVLMPLIYIATDVPDWKVCKMREGVLPDHYMNTSRVPKMRGGFLPRTEQTFQSGQCTVYM